MVLVPGRRYENCTRLYICQGLALLLLLCHQWHLKNTHTKIMSTNHCKTTAQLHSWLVTRFVTRLTRRVATSGTGTAYPSGEPEFTPVFSGVRVTRSLVLCVCFVDRYLSFCPFSFGHCVFCPSQVRFTDSDYPFGIFELFFLQCIYTISYLRMVWYMPIVKSEYLIISYLYRRITWL